MMKKFTAVLLSLVMILSTVVLPIMADGGNTGPQLVYTVNFNGDSTFAPTSPAEDQNLATFTPSADGKSLTIANNGVADANKGGVTRDYWGGVINGLSIDDTTVYTMIYKVKCGQPTENNAAIGVGGVLVDGEFKLMDGTSGNTAKVNYIGQYTNHNKQARLVKALSDLNSNTPITTASLDTTDGFVTTKLVYDFSTGKLSNYYLKSGTTGENESDWMMLSKASMNAGDNAKMGFVLYVCRPWYTDGTVIKDVQIYKETVQKEEVIVPTGPAATCVVGKTITIDGAMGANEGWSATPLYNMSLQVSSPIETTGTEDTEPATARYSYDTDYLYIYYETANTDTMSKHDASVYFLIFPKETHFNDANASANGETLQLRVMMGQENSTWEGKNSEGDAGAVGGESVIGQFYYHKDRKAYTAGTTYFDDTKVAYTVTAEKKTIELRFPLAESYKTALSADGGANFRISMWERNNIPADNAGYIIAGGTYDWNGTTGIDINLPQITAEVMTAVDVAGKTVTVDGVMGEEEGWAAYPFTYLDSLRSNPTKADTETQLLTTGMSEVRISYDGDFMYLFFKTFQTQKSRIVFQLGFEDAKRGTKDHYLQIGISTKTSAVRGTEGIAPITEMLYDSGSGGSYGVGDDFYDKTQVAVVVDDTAGVTTVELALPIPQAVCVARMSGEYEDITLGVWERFVDGEGDATNLGLVATEGLAWNGGLMKLSMSKNESGIYNEFVEWLEGTKTTTNHESLKNLTVNLIGDDLLMGESLLSAYLWKNMLTTKYEWTTVDYTEKGLLVSTHDKDQLIPLVKKYRTMTNNSPNLVVVSGGLNDYVKGAPIGTIDDTTDSTYMGALNVLIKGLRQKYPEACIVFTTGWNATNATTENTVAYQDYLNALIAVCEKREVYCFKACDPTVSGVDMSSEEFRTANCMAADNTVNLNLDGMKLVMPKYEAFIAESIAHWAENKETIMENQKDFINGGSSNNGGSTNNGGSSNNGTNEETKAPETSAPATTTPTEKKGCGGVIGVGSAFAVLAIVSCAGVACFKKHDEE